VNFTPEIRFSCVIVDNDESSRLILENFISQFKYLELKASLETGIEAFNFLSENPDVNILLLDIDMPEMNGIELIRAIPKKPETIFISAHEQFAVEAFELGAQDYLMKPFSFERFARAIQRVSVNLNQSYKELIPNREHNEIFVKSNARFHKLSYDEILFIEALADYVLVNTTTSKHIVYSTMKAMEEKLAGDTFMRIHRSFIINKNKIQQVENSAVIVNGKEIPVSKTYQNLLFEKLNFL
jgi:two-component system LytT family response regulator